MNKYNIFRRYFSVICIASCLHSCIWGSGSYSDAEVYLISLPSSDNLIDSIIKMKHNYPQMSAFHKNENDDIISMDHWSINFYTSYFIIDNICYMCVVNTNQQNQQFVNLEFVSIVRKEDMEKGNWKRINTSDLTKEENEAYKRIFEDSVVSQIGVSWQRK